MARSGPRRVHKYELEFKLRAVQLTEQPGVLVRDVAASLSIHFFMLSRWRKQVADGDLVGQVPELDLGSVAELQRLRDADAYVRTLVIHGGRSVLQTAHRRKNPDRLHRWALEVERRQGRNRAAVAVTNKLIRIAWAVWARGIPYDGSLIEPVPNARPTKKRIPRSTADF